MLTVAALVIAARPAAADPDGARVFTVPTAWLLPAGAAGATLGIDHRGDTTAVASFGLGMAEAEIDQDTDIRGCTDCAMRPLPLRLGRAAFRLGVRQDAWLPGMPALVLGVRATFAAYDPAVPDPRASDAYAVASRDLGIVRLHAGVDALSASVAGRRAAARLRPLAALEVHPPMYPRSSLLGDLAWEPNLDAVHGASLGWLLGVGVRYQAFAWAQIELAVRARQGEDLGAATVMVRVNAFTRP
ncbi:MAG: hypothetical protein E6J90_11120 [Deltaproteobacteria bacterium]|nr:MAG: hypothetical protein E6J91_11195 [Deltaproteobacteria bacterium]TMQ23208.1 MAG: hypothetical protein E6J90_11120 [Deltaproteobacteria bacterium]